MKSETLTADRIAEIKARTIDLSDIPELTEADFSRGSFRNIKEKPLSAGNMNEMLSLAASGDFGESPASIQRFRELTKDDGW